jgi:hypothetical protein
MANDQGAAAHAQREVELDQRLANEFDAAIAASVQRIEDFADRRRKRNRRAARAAAPRRAPA